jgi:hypothetical protein
VDIFNVVNHRVPYPKDTSLAKVNADAEDYLSDKINRYILSIEFSSNANKMIILRLAKRSKKQG